MGLEEHSQRLKLQRSLFSTVLAFAALLYLVAVAMGFLLIGKLNENKNLHWHASLLIAAFIIPPTVLTVGLMRGIFRSKDDKKEVGDDVPSQSIVDLCKDLIKTVLDAKVKD